MKKTIINTCILLFFSMVTMAGLAQSTGGEVEITGKVIDPQGVPLPGVNITEKGVRNGAVTDFDGEYRIRAASNATLVFTYVGMKTVELPVDGKSKLNVTLLEDTATLDEVIVVGYGSQKREAITGSVESIKGAEIEDLPVGDLGTALVGRVLGVTVSGGNTRPGNPAQIQIRNPIVGTNSRAKDATFGDPLYVIDGVIQIDPNTGFPDATLFNNLDASEVESISFLKDASAAIYGSRAAQGVILVTTKRGKKGPAKFSYSGNFSVSDETYRTEMLDAYQYAQAFNIMNGPNGVHSFNPSAAQRTTYFFSQEEMDYFRDNNIHYDALDDYWTAASTQRHNINMTGGTDTATYFGGISYYTQEGNLGTLDYDKWTFRAGTNVKLAHGFSADFQVSGFFTDQSRTASSIGNQTPEDDFRQLQNRAPFLPMYVDGMPAVLIGSEGADDFMRFHYGEILRLRNISENSDHNLAVNLNVEYEVPFVPGLKFKVNYARQAFGARGEQRGSEYDLYQFFGPDQNDDLTYITYESGQGPLGTNTVRRTDQVINSDRILVDNTISSNEQSRFQASYENDFGKHSISSLFAVEKAERSYRTERVIKYGVPDWSDGMWWQLTGDFDQEHTFNRRTESGELGYIGRVNYNYDDKYYGEFLYRSDASAKFAPENYWGNFYSISAGWVLSKEDFFNSNTIDYLKLRASVGSVGKDDTRPWQWKQTFGIEPAEGAVFGGNGSVSPGLQDQGQANRDIRWGKELKTNFGIEAKFLDNRLSVTAENFYNIATESLINLNSGVPFTVGGSTASSNNGRSDTWGTEISLGWHDTAGKDFNYGVNFNIAWYNNDRFDGNWANEDFWYPWSTDQPGPSNRGFWGYDYMGMFKNQTDIDNYLAETGVTTVFDLPASELKPGMLYYRDVRGQWDPDTRTFAEPDGIIDENDQVQLKGRPKGPQGFNSTFNFSYKNFSLNTVLSVNWGGYREVGNAKDPLSTNAIYNNYENRPEFWANMYDPDLNPNGTIPNLSANDYGEINTVSSKFWQVSSFSLLMRNINLSYKVPKTITEKVGINSFRLNLVAMNPFILFNPYKDYGLSPYGSYNSYPVLRTYSLGLNIGF